jgi:hypothetical protein
VSPARTKPGTRKLSDVARHVVVPTGIVSTGYPAVRDRCRDLGIVHDDWQEGLGRLILGKRADGKYAATVGGVVISIPRQVGKTFTIGSIMFALCLLFPGMTIIWTAHRTRTSNETFNSMRAMARRVKIKPFIRAVRATNGEQEVAFRNGSRILFGAREQGFGRGFAEVDVVVFDEAQILTERALEDMVAPTNRAKHPHGALLFYMGTPPRPVDPGEAFTNKRDKALSGKSTDMVYVEMSADENADPDDHEQWAKANPSYPEHTPPESMMRLRENVGSDESFLREGLGIWDANASSAVIPSPMWQAAGEDQSLAVDRFSLGIEVAPDMARASVAFAGLRADGTWHVELDEARDGAAWVVPYVKALLAENPQLRGVGVDAGSPAKALLADFEAAGVRVITPTVQDLGGACSQLLAGVVDGSVRHIKQGHLTTAVAGAGKRKLGDTGLWVWHRSSAAADITPVQAVTLALWVARLDKIWKKPLRRREDTTSRRAVVL